MIYENDNIRIRPFTVDDTRDYAYQAAFHDPEVCKYNSHGLFPYTHTKREEFAKELESSTSKIVWAIEIKIPGNPGRIGEGSFDPGESAKPPKWAMIGNCALQSINWFNRSAEFAIVIWDKNCWSKGVGKRALIMVLAHAFRKLGLNRVWSGTAATNLGMQKVAAAASMILEGAFREGMFLDGKFEAVYYYSILAKDYFDTVEL